MVDFSLLAAEIDSLVWGTPANFNGFHVILCRKLLADVSDVDATNTQLQSDLQAAQMKIDELQKEVRLERLKIYYHFCCVPVERCVA